MTKSPMNVLLVDDKRENLDYLSALLLAHGFNVDTAINGADALAQAHRSPPDVVISDLLMPVMDGYTLLRHWKADVAFKGVPFLVYTATYTDADDERLALDMGADAFILKPAEPDTFLTELQRVLARPPQTPRIARDDDVDADSMQNRYSSIVVRKLEQKSRQLEGSNRELLREIFARDKIAQTQIAILNALPAHIALIDADGVIVSVNEAWRRFGAANGFESADFGVGRNYLAVCASATGANAEEAPAVTSGIRAVLKGDAPAFELEYPCHSPQQERWFRMMVSPLHGYEASGAVVMHVDVSERKGAEQRLQESQQQYFLLLNSTAEGIYGLDLDGLCTFCNPAAARLLGYDSPDTLVGARMHELHHHTTKAGRPLRADECRAHGGLDRHEPSHGDNEIFFRKDGRSFPVEYWSHPIWQGTKIIGTVVAFLDISERRDLEAQFLQSQKMEAIGRLAGGVAHDFNNCLQVMLTCTELLTARLAEDKIDQEYLRAIQTAGQHGAALTRQLLAFSRKQVVRPQLLDLNVVISDIGDMLRHMLGEDIRLSITYDAAVCAVEADSSQIEQLLMNLAVNSRDAMSSGGAFSIRTGTVERDFDTAHLSIAEEAAQRYVVLTVSDTGRGMDAGIRARMFEPFFTTKGPGKGTGLGLSTVYGIVKQNRGFIEVDSTPGAGTSFRLYFPAADAIPEIAGSPARAERRRPGTESILLVEDEDSLLMLVGSTLRAHGYAVLEANSGQAALAAAADPTVRIDLVVTDVILPDLSGPKVAEQLLASRPGISILYISGYTDEYIPERALLSGEIQLLEKPFTISALLSKVRGALDRTTKDG